MSFKYNLLLLPVSILMISIVNCTDSIRIVPKKQDLTSSIDSLFLSAVKNNEIPGAVVIIKENEGEFYHKSFGFQNISTGILMEKNSIFRLASMTKAVTAVAVLQLVEKGQINLDDKIEKYIPAFKDAEVLTEVLKDSTCKTVPAKSAITIKQLLTHTSGIGYGFQDEKYNSLVIKNGVSEGFCEDTRSSKENTLRIAELPLLSEPGTKYIYSMSYDVLGTLIEDISGMRYDEYVKKYVLEPMEMKDSYFIIPESERYRLVDVYQPIPGKHGLEPTSYPDIEYPVIDNRQFFSGGGDLCGTAADYEKFIRMIHNQGIYNGKRILGAEYIQQMLSKQTHFDDGDSDQGFAAWVVNKKGAEKGPMSEGAYGFGGFFDTYSWVDPQEKFTAVLLLQMYPTNEHQIHEKFQKLVYKTLKKSK